MSVLHVLPALDSKQAQVKFKIYKIYSIYHGAYRYLCKLRVHFRAARSPGVADYLYSSAQTVRRGNHFILDSRYLQSVDLMKVGENVLTEYLDVIIEWKTAIVKELRTNHPMKRMSAQKQEIYENVSICYICRYAFEEDNSKGSKVRDYNQITKVLIRAAH